MTVLAQTKFETATILRNGEQLLLNILLPIAALVTLTKVPVIGGQSLPINLAYASSLALAWASTAFSSQAIAVAFDRRWGVLRMLATTPLGARGLFAGKFGAITIVALVQAAILTLVGLFLGLGINVGAVAPGTLFLILGLAGFLGLGLLIGGTMKPEAVLAVANLLWVVMAGLGGLLLPLSEYPSWWGTVLTYTPPGALGEGLRSLASGEGYLIYLLVLAGWAVGGGLLAASRFQWDSK